MLKHFLKTLTIFVVMIIIGLVGVFLVNRYGNEGELTDALNNKVRVAK